MATPSSATLPRKSPPAPNKVKPAPKRKRGGQPGNQNARKLGIFSVRQPGPLGFILSRAKTLYGDLNQGHKSINEVVTEAWDMLGELEQIETETEPSLETHRLGMRLIQLSTSAKNRLLPAELRQHTLEQLAIAPFTWFAADYRAHGIDRDADSFFAVSEKSARNSPLFPPPQMPSTDLPASPSSPPQMRSTDLPASPSSPPQMRSMDLPASPSSPLQMRSIWGGVGGGAFPTSLTDEQWGILEPLIPPDPYMDWLYGQPPILIAANRWGFTHHIPGEFSDFVALQKYYEVLNHYPALLEPPPARTTPKRGRPREQKSPRLLLDAILWKLATGRTWEELPTEFPSPRKCAKYYRRLFLSGRLYTLLYALHQHLRLEALVDTSVLVEQGVFTTTPSQHIALSPGVPATWQNYTALLFMQLARDAFMYSQREKRRQQRCYPHLPLLKGEDALSTGRWDAQPTPPSPPIQPLEKSPAAKKLQAIEKNRAAQERELRKRLRTLAKYFPASPNQPGTDETEP